jgi:mannose-6-phosphate isomerase-like protein (cupin superfamily)
MFDERQLPERRDAVAPDGSDVRLLLTLDGGSVAHFQLPPGHTSVAVRHRTVEEIWVFLSGHGVMWRRDDLREAELPVGPGTAVTIPAGTDFQFRADAGVEPLAAIGVTMPPWPGDGEAIRAAGTWDATVPPGPGLFDE